jgi:hypothetical protein
VLVREKKGSTVQNASVVSALRYMTAGLPLGVALISVVCMQWYHIDEVRACAVCRRLENRRGGERAESREQRAESREQRAESREQRAERREERGERREERGERREERGERREGAHARTRTRAHSSADSLLAHRVSARRLACLH